ncbi:hypothetical protein [Actinomyces provencensis]|uniref:hypothetical protein n=1 Tax=Actinomyces provencensis TaxID=1720198 RepID=UPI00096A6C6D|nr:hypothetical protein [Actinomyces provencensis]
MSTQHRKGVVIPSAGDDLLDAWVVAVDTAGIITHASSVASARVALTQWETAGAAPTTDHPAYFDVNGIFYKADGTKNHTTWVLKPWNEKEFVEQAIGSGATVSVGNGEFKGILKSTLPVRPYDRMVTAHGLVWGVATGSLGVDMRIGDDHVAAQFWAGGNSQFAINTGKVPAGVAPDIEVGVIGFSGGGSLRVSVDDKWVRLVVTADPITMA